MIFSLHGDDGSPPSPAVRHTPFLETAEGATTNLNSSAGWEVRTGQVRGGGIWIGEGGGTIREVHNKRYASVEKSP